jgi:hypothetical protein
VVEHVLDLVERRQDLVGDGLLLGLPQVPVDGIDDRLFVLLHQPDQAVELLPAELDRKGPALVEAAPRDLDDLRGVAQRQVDDRLGSRRIHFHFVDRSFTF